MSARVRFAGASFTYAGGGRPALSDLRVELAPGEVVALAGAPGAGTTTFLLLAAGFAPRLTGGVLTGDRASTVVRPGIVFATPWTQLTGLSHSVRAEIAFGPAQHGWDRDRVLALVEDAMRRLDIGYLADRDPATLSGGELQRVIVASALALEPDLLALDDPAAELDPDAADGLYALLPEVARSGTTVLVATPDTTRVGRVATRALVFEEGRIVRDDRPAELLA